MAHHQYHQSTFSTTVHLHSTDLPTVVWASFRENPHASNIMFAHAQKTVSRSSTSPSHADGDVWIVLWECDTRKNSTTPSVAFVLSCTTGPLGSYPVFIYTPSPASSLQRIIIRPKLLSIVRALRDHVPLERVFSVFAVDVVADTFADIWTSETGIPLAPSPNYYHARLMCCDNTALRSRPLKKLQGVEVVLRRAVNSDVTKVGMLCHGFADGSEPFVLSHEKALQEAKVMIQNKQVWVHEVKAPGRAAEIASIVAATRTTDTVAAITKVFTDPQWRSRGCAERLMHHVCQDLLQTKKTVILYVAHNNPAASSVYRNVGFVGFFVYSGDVMDESWKELGFDRSYVELGHW